jgi:F0F1-type ATP synthase membrane subunit b/b'
VELRQQVAAETMRLAEELVKSRMDAAQQQRLVDDYLKHLGGRR